MDDGVTMDANPRSLPEARSPASALAPLVPPAWWYVPLPPVRLHEHWRMQLLRRGSSAGPVQLISTGTSPEPIDVLVDPPVLADPGVVEGIQAPVVVQACSGSKCVGEGLGWGTMDTSPTGCSWVYVNGWEGMMGAS